MRHAFSEPKDFKQIFWFWATYQNSWSWLAKNFERSQKIPIARSPKHHPAIRKGEGWIGLSHFINWDLGCQKRAAPWHSSRNDSNLSKQLQVLIATLSFGGYWVDFMISINRVLLGFIKSRPLTLIKKRLFKHTVKTRETDSLFSFVLLIRIHVFD